MFRIEITDERRTLIERLFCDWLTSSGTLKKLQAVLNNDKTFCKACGINASNAHSIERFLLSRADNLKSYLNLLAGSATQECILNGYKSFRRDKAAEIVMSLGITACPYCNQYDIPVIVMTDGRCRFEGELDHFYNNSTYPHLALCLYNLVPCCKVCNHEKLKSLPNIQNPYDAGYILTTIKFATDVDDSHDFFYFEGMSDNFRIITKTESDFDRDEDKTFQLSGRYSLLKENAREIILKSRMYNELYIGVLDKFPGMSEESIKQYIFGYREDPNHRALSKFNSDITDEFVLP